MPSTRGPLDQHFALLGVIKGTRGSERESAARASVAMSTEAAAHWRRDYPDEELPMHPGFDRLIIEHGKRKDWAAALATALLAKAEGWRGDWDRRIARAAKHVPRETK
jgi:hypothetical protein